MLGFLADTAEALVALITVSKDSLRRAILLAYRILGPLILGLSGLGEAIVLGWIDDPFTEGPLYDVYVISVFLIVFSLPVVLIVGLRGSVLFAREWPFVLPLWLVTLLVLLFGANVLDLLPDQAPVVRDTVLYALLVAAAFAATIVGYRPGNR